MSREKRITRSAREIHYLQNIGERIRAARKREGYSQEEFADIAGFSRSYYTEIETGKRNISVLNLIKIIEALGIDANQLIVPMKGMKRDS